MEQQLEHFYQVLTFDQLKEITTELMLELRDKEICYRIRGERIVELQTRVEVLKQTLERTQMELAAERRNERNRRVV